MNALRRLQPIIALVGLAFLLVALATIVRTITAHAGFLVERQIVLAVWLAGLLIAGAIFAWVVRRSMRRETSRSGLLLMVLTVLVLASPMAMMLLEHPAP